MYSNSKHKQSTQTLSQLTEINSLKLNNISNYNKSHLNQQPQKSNKA